MENQTVQKAYEEYVNTTNKITEETVGYKKKKQVEGMPKALENKCNDRREARLKYLKQPSNNELRENYRTINRQVKSEVLQQKRLTMEKKVEQLERDFKNNNSHNLFKTVRELEKKPYRQLNTIKDKNGTIQCEQEEVLRCWQDHFTTQLNTEFPHNDEAPNDVLEGDAEINDNPPTEHEVETSIKSLKNKKSPGWDNITAEVLKAGGRYMVEMLQCLFKKHATIYFKGCKQKDSFGIGSIRKTAENCVVQKRHFTKAQSQAVQEFDPTNSNLCRRNLDIKSRGHKKTRSV
ncbi:hypothetical protein Pcinc_003737 [Petrolisthes cinctipes]|nr:hypothetical protein Pcinc_003737 [Petrolisthes cinctipes]